MSATPKLSPTPRLALILATLQRPERAFVLHPGGEQVAYPALYLALDALRSEAAK